MRLSPTPIEPIVKNRTVPLSCEQAFHLFTERMGEWWPLATHSIAESDAVGVRFEPGVGGRVAELTTDGTEHCWAEVIAWDPPHRFALAWHPNLDPEAASIVDVRFHEDGGATALELIHKGWEEFGTDLGAELRDAYGPGWDVVLSPLSAAAEDTRLAG